MAEENKTDELKEDELSEASGGLENEIQTDDECANFNGNIRDSNRNCCDRGKTKSQGAKYSWCLMCGKFLEGFL